MSQNHDDIRDGFRRHLLTVGQDEQSAALIAAAMNLDAFTGDDGSIDVNSLHRFADRRGLNLRAGRPRNFGAGQQHPGPLGPLPGEAEATRRFGPRPDQSTSSHSHGGRGAAEAERRYGGHQSSHGDANRQHR